jgi:hypothetical protein
MKWAYSTSTLDGFMTALVKSEPRIAVWAVREQNLGSITAPGVKTDPASFPIHALTPFLHSVWHEDDH